MEALVVQLEGLALRRPRVYTALAVGVALLGLAILFLVFGLALSSLGLLVGAVVYVITSGGKHFLVILNAGKLLLLLAVPAWFMIKASVTVLFTRFPEPEGRELTPDEAPSLFAAIDRLRQQVKGPPVHKVMLTEELNAAIQQYPRFGLFGWERNYLFLGLPLLEILTEEEALSVLAHEYGHLSGHHNRLGGFIYRLRASWARLQETSEQWRDWGSRLIARLMRWYAPYFNAYTFVLARQNEYLADRTAVEIAGRENAAAALTRFNIAAAFRHMKFTPAINRRADVEPDPPESLDSLWREMLPEAFAEPLRQELLDAVRGRKTDHFDTHPALADRLAAMGVAVDQPLARMEPPARTAAEAWLGTALDGLRLEFDRRWRESVTETWRAHYADASRMRERLAELDALPTLSPDQQWERLSSLEALQQEVDALAVLDAILAVNPNHLPARVRRGFQALGHGDESGVADLEAAMAADHNVIVPACEALMRFYETRDSYRAEAYRKRGQAHAALLDQANARSSELRLDDILLPSDLPADSVARIVGLLREHAPRLGHVYLARRRFEGVQDLDDHVLVFETRSLTPPSKAREIAEKLAAQISFPLLILHLEDSIAQRFRKRFRKEGIEPLSLS